jgi:DNA-binding transcriptional regulator YiaG
MPNLASVLKDEVRRLARKEIREQVSATMKASAQHRRDIADLKRKIDQQARRIAFLERQEKKRLTSEPSPKKAQGARFSPAGVLSHRTKLGLSAENFGKLIGVSGLTVYNWEKGKSRPRAKQLAALVEVRGIGKREANRRLEMLDK